MHERHGLPILVLWPQICVEGSSGQVEAIGDDMWESTYFDTSDKSQARPQPPWESKVSCEAAGCQSLQKTHDLTTG